MVSITRWSLPGITRQHVSLLSNYKLWVTGYNGLLIISYRIQYELFRKYDFYFCDKFKLNSVDTQHCSVDYEDKRYNLHSPST